MHNICIICVGCTNTSIYHVIPLLSYSSLYAALKIIISCLVRGDFLCRFEWWKCHADTGQQHHSRLYRQNHRFRSSTQLSASVADPDTHVWNGAAPTPGNGVINEETRCFVFEIHVHLRALHSLIHLYEIHMSFQISPDWSECPRNCAFLVCLPPNDEVYDFTVRYSFIIPPHS